MTVPVTVLQCCSAGKGWLHGPSHGVNLKDQRLNPGNRESITKKKVFGLPCEPEWVPVCVCLCTYGLFYHIVVHDHEMSEGLNEVGS